MHHLALWANVVQTFWPVTTHSPFDLTALVFRDARSEPDSGSEKPWHQISSPVRIGLSQRSFCSSVPWWITTGPPITMPSTLAGEGAHARHLLAEQRLLDQRGAAAAVLLRPGEARVAGVVELALPAAAVVEGGVLAGRVLAGVVVGEPGAQLVAEGLFGGRERQVHGAVMYQGVHNVEAVHPTSLAACPAAPMASTPRWWPRPSARACSRRSARGLGEGLRGRDDRRHRARGRRLQEDLLRAFPRQAGLLPRRLRGGERRALRARPRGPRGRGRLAPAHARRHRGLPPLARRRAGAGARVPDRGGGRRSARGRAPGARCATGTPS